MKRAKWKNNVKISNPVNSRLDMIKGRNNELRGELRKLHRKTVEVEMGDMQEILRDMKDSLENLIYIKTVFLPIN